MPPYAGLPIQHIPKRVPVVLSHPFLWVSRHYKLTWYLNGGGMGDGFPWLPETQCSFFLSYIHIFSSTPFFPVKGLFGWATGIGTGTLAADWASSSTETPISGIRSETVGVINRIHISLESLATWRPGQYTVPSSALQGCLRLIVDLLVPGRICFGKAPRACKTAS